MQRGEVLVHKNIGFRLVLVRAALCFSWIACLSEERFPNHTNQTIETIGKPK